MALERVQAVVVAVRARCHPLRGGGTTSSRAVVARNEPNQTRAAVAVAVGAAGAAPGMGVASPQQGRAKTLHPAMRTPALVAGDKSLLRMPGPAAPLKATKAPVATGVEAPEGGVTTGVEAKAAQEVPAPEASPCM